MRTYFCALISYPLSVSNSTTGLLPGSSPLAVEAIDEMTPDKPGLIPRE